MTDAILRAQIDGAKAYESLMVPALFGPWAPKLADLANIRPGDRVLDIASGTGILAREAASRTGPAGSVAGVDPNPGMLAVAAQLAPAVQWREGVAEALPFPDQSFDIVVSQFGLMFFTDHRKALREALRVLAPGGRLAFAVWDSLDNIPAYAAEVSLLQQIAGQQAADALRAPFVFGDRHDLAVIFADAGVSSIEITTHRGTARFPGIRIMVEADLRGWLPVMGVHLPEDQIAHILQEAEHALGAYLRPDRTVQFEASAHIVTGTRT